MTMILTLQRRKLRPRETMKWAHVVPPGPRGSWDLNPCSSRVSLHLRRLSVGGRALALCPGIWSWASSEEEPWWERGEGGGWSQSSTKGVGGGTSFFPEAHWGSGTNEVLEWAAWRPRAWGWLPHPNPAVPRSPNYTHGWSGFRLHPAFAPCQAQVVGLRTETNKMQPLH